MRISLNNPGEIRTQHRPPPEQFLPFSFPKFPGPKRKNFASGNFRSGRIGNILNKSLLSSILDTRAAVGKWPLACNSHHRSCFPRPVSAC